jgi:hypothetical protein
LNWRSPLHCLIHQNTFSIQRLALIDLAKPVCLVVRPSIAEAEGRAVY